MSNEEYIPFAEIIAELKNVCAAGKTGVMYITSVENRSAQLMIDNGDIVFLYFFNKRGREALKLMAGIETGRFRFQEGSSPTLRVDLPDTDDILRYLSAASGLEPGSDIVEKSVATSTRSVEVTKGIVTLTHSQRQTLESTLAGYIGPMAAIICEDHLNSVNDVWSAIDLLAAEIPVPSQADAFRQQMTEVFSS